MELCFAVSHSRLALVKITMRLLQHQHDDRTYTPERGLPPMGLAVCHEPA
jgi:hypothetical protein